MRSSGESLLAVINDMLDFSKIEAGRLELESHRFRPCRPGRRRRRRRGAAGLAPRVSSCLADVDPDVPRLVRGDPTRMRQILVNLLGNAVKFTERGEVTLAVEGRDSDGRGRHAATSRCTTPASASRPSRPSLFEPFIQADISTTRRSAAPASDCRYRRLAAAMGGAFGLKSEGDEVDLPVRGPFDRARRRRRRRREAAVRIAGSHRRGTSSGRRALCGSWSRSAAT